MYWFYTRLWNKLNIGYLATTTTTTQEDIYLTRPLTMTTIAAMAIFLALAMWVCLCARQGKHKRRFAGKAFFWSMSNITLQVSCCWTCTKVLFLGRYENISHFQSDNEMESSGYHVKMVFFVGAAAALLANAVYTSNMASDIANRKEMGVDMGVLRSLGFKVGPKRLELRSTLVYH